MHTTVMVDRAVVTVTVTGTQLPVSTPKALDAPIAAADGAALEAEAATTVTYLVEVLVPVTVVVIPASETSPGALEAAAADSVGRVA